MKNKKIIGFTQGFFDIMHPGHILFFRDCKRHCDYLIIAVHEYNDRTKQPDGRNKSEPIQSADERLLMVQSIKYVDEAFLYDGEGELYDYVDKHSDNIDVRFFGGDHKDKPFTGDDIEIYNKFCIRDHDYSTTNLIKSIVEKRKK